MNIYHGLEEIPFDSQTVLTIGTFDGVHCGHRRIIDALLAEAARISGRSVIITFSPHPQEILRRTGDTVSILTTLTERERLFAQSEIDALVILEFTREFAATPWEEFGESLLREIGIAHMIVGHDHAFGKDRQGNAESLRSFGQEKGFGVTEIGPLIMEGETVSSTKIRRALMQGDIDTATRFLGRLYSVTGTVVQGEKRGRQIGFPTANIQLLDSTKLVPGNGVYCTTVEVQSTLVRGITNIGYRPTFSDEQMRTIEANLFDFDADIYNQIVTVEFIKFVRSEQKFASKDLLVQQIEQDLQVCRGLPAREDFQPSYDR